MKINKSQLVTSIASIAIFLISLAVMICDFVIPLDLWTHPILTFIFCLSVGFFVLSILLGMVKKSVWYLFLGAICVTFSIIYPFAHTDFWWIGIIVTIVSWALIAIISYILMGSRTEDIALNKSPEYKNYKQRAAEKQEAEKAEQELQEELPQIKSFKD